MALDGEHSESQDTSMSHFEQMDLVAKIFIGLIIIVIISIFVYGFLRLCYNACCGDCSEWRSSDGTYLPSGYLPSYNRRNRHRLDGGEDGEENCSEVDHIKGNRGSGRVRGGGRKHGSRRGSDDSVLQNELKGVQRNLIPKVKNSKPKQKRKSLSESSSNSSYEEEPENEEEDVEVDEGEPENEGKAESEEEEEEGKVEEAEGKDEVESEEEEEEEPKEEHEEEPQGVPEEEPEPEPDPEPEIEVEFDCGGD